MTGQQWYNDLVPVRKQAIIYPYDLYLSRKLLYLLCYHTGGKTGVFAEPLVYRAVPVTVT